MGYFTKWSSNEFMLVHHPDAKLRTSDKRFNNMVDFFRIGLISVPHVEERAGKEALGNRRTLGIHCQLSAKGKGEAASLPP